MIKPRTIGLWWVPVIIIMVALHNARIVNLDICRPGDTFVLCGGVIRPNE